MAHPLACQLAPQMHRDVGELHQIVAQWVLDEPRATERARYRFFGAGLAAVKQRIAARATPPTEEEIEIALTVLLVIAGRRTAQVGPRSASLA